jgi:hypothetical protein
MKIKDILVWLRLTLFNSRQRKRRSRQRTVKSLSAEITTLIRFNESIFEIMNLTFEISNLHSGFRIDKSQLNQVFVRDIESLSFDISNELSLKRMLDCIICGLLKN